MRKRFAPILGCAVLVTVTFLVLPVRPAAACSCAGGTDEEQFASVDAVFTARLVEREEPRIRPDGTSSTADFATLRFAVDAVHKGDVAVDQAVVTEQAGMSCGLEIDGEGPFLVFARRSHWDQPVPDGTLYAGLCDGTRALAAGPVPASFGAAQEPSAAPVDPLPAGPVSIDDAPEDTTPYVVGGAVAAVGLAGGAIVLLVRRRTGRVAA